MKGKKSIFSIGGGSLRSGHSSVAMNIVGPDEQTINHASLVSGYERTPSEDGTNQLRPSPSSNGPFSGIPASVPMFIELQKLVARVRGGLEFEDADFATPMAIHSRVLWLQIARWVNFEQNYDEVEQRFTEAHVSPMKFTRITQLYDQIKQHCAIQVSPVTNFGLALDAAADYAVEHGCVLTTQEHDVLRAILLAERWHPEVKGQISDVAEFEGYWNANITEAINKTKKTEVERHRINLVSLHHQSSHPHHRFNNTLTHCLDPGAEACTVLCGTVQFLRKPLIMFIRLINGIEKSCASEVKVPVRFLFIYLGPSSQEYKYSKLARVFAIMMTSPTFRQVIYEANEVEDVLQSIDLFMADALVMPISKYANPDALAGMVRQIEAYKREMEEQREAREKLQAEVAAIKKPSRVELLALEASHRKMSALDLALQDGALDQLETVRKVDTEQPVISPGRRFRQDFCPPGKDLFQGLRPWAKRFPSDFKDAMRKENIGIVLGGVMFLYFVNLAPAITFGALLNDQVDPSFSISMCIFATGILLVLFTLLGGQPLGFIGITGPTFILESSLASVAKDAGIELSLLRFWVAFYCALFGLLCIIFNASVLANHVRRSVEEIFNTFIAFFFLLKALITMFRLIPPGLSSTSTSAEQLRYSQHAAIAGATLFLAFVMLQFCLNLAQLKHGNYFRRTIRKLLGALNVPLGMLLLAVLNQIFFLGFDLEMVNIPPSNQINATNWFHVVNFANVTGYPVEKTGLVHGIGIAIGFTLTIIVFTEVAFNGITAMKNRAVKANVFVVDLVLMVIIFPLLCGILGWPFVSGATVRTMSNLVALVKMDHAPAPGMPHRVIGTVEQRVSGSLVGLLVCLSVFLGSILRFIPVAALYGMFLYMGVMGLRDLQFFQRCLALMKRRKHWEDWECVRGLPSAHILSFAIIQGVVVMILVALNLVSEFTAASYAGIVFPIVVLLYAILRELALPRWTWLSLYLHQLDKKYKLNPVMVKNQSLTIKANSLGPKESHLTSMGSKRPSGNDIHIATQTLSDDDGNYSEHDDGIVRRTWAT